MEELRQANSDLKNVMASTQIGTLFLDRELRIQRYTPSVEELFNIRPEDEDRPVGDITHHLDYDRLEADAEQVLEDLQPIEREAKADTGEWFLIRLHPYRTHNDHIDGVVVAFIGITDRREAEQALRRSERLYRLATEAAQVGTWALNFNTGEYFLSATMVEHMGFAPDQFPSPETAWQQVVPQEAWIDAVHPEDRPSMREALHAAAEETGTFELKFRIQPGDGTVRWLYSKGEMERTDDGTPQLYGATLNITDRKDTERALQRSEEFYRLAVEAGQVGTWDLNLDTWALYVSPKMAEIVGFDPEEFDVPEGHWQQVVPEEAWRATVHPEDRRRVEVALLRSADEEVTFDEQLRIHWDDDEVRWIHSTGEVVRDDDGTLHLHGATIDVTEEKQARAKLRAANDRLEERTAQVESLSQALTSAEEGVRTRISQMLHDDVQQSLFAATLKLETLEDRVPLDDDQRDLLRTAKEMVQEGIEMTRTLSKELTPPTEDKSLRGALQWLTDQMDDAYDLTVTMQAKGTTGPVDYTIRTLLFHVVRELLFNVVKHAGVDEATLFLVEGESRLRVVVEDEGTGFDPSTLQAQSNGTGLMGLPHRIGLIGGHLEVDSAPGKGTRITLEVPRETGYGEEDVPL